MKVKGLLVTVFAAAGAAALSGCERAVAVEERVIASHRLTELGGADLGVAVLQVTYGPGESAAPHSHRCPVVGYVQYGKLRVHMEGEAPAVYGAGETFYEAAGQAHLVSANASRELPVQFLAWVTCQGDPPVALAGGAAP